MTKNFLQDIVPPKRSIRNIPLSTSKKRVAPQEDIILNKQNSSIPSRNEYSSQQTTEEVADDVRPPQPPRPIQQMTMNADDLYKKKRIWSKPLFIGISIVILLIIIIGVLSAFSGATITIEPKQINATLAERLSVTNTESSNAGAGLVYKVVSLSETSSKEITASGEEEVQTKSSGIITVYNNYTDKEQPLVKNTRFESPSGKIYRIEKSIVVPGKSSSKQGSIDVEVFADEPGKEYDLETATFTIPGFKDQPQFDSFRAEIKTPISGGFNGIRKVVSNEDLSTAESDLKQQLTESLKNQIREQVSEDVIVIFDDKLLSFVTLSQKEGGADSVIVELTGTIKSIVFNKGEFSNALAEENLTIFNKEDSVLLSESGISISLSPEFSPNAEVSDAIIEVSGNTVFTWQTDHELLKQKLAGKSRKELKSVLQEFNSIAKVKAVIRPFWKSKFPENIDKTTVDEEIVTDEDAN